MVTLGWRVDNWKLIQLVVAFGYSKIPQIFH